MQDHVDHDFFSEQTRILEELTHALVEATPEWWTEAQLELAVEGEATSHVISSELNPHDVVIPTEELFEQTIALQVLFETRSKPFKTAVVRVRRDDRNGEESWKLDVSYTY